MKAKVPAYVFLWIWGLLQFFSGALTVTGGAATNVAYLAHVGGFVFGLLFAAFGRRRYLEKFRTRRQVFYSRR